MVEKIIRDGKVAVIVSPGFGAGFVTWNEGISPFEPKIIKMIEENRKNEITEEWCKKELGVDAYCGGANDLEIVWLPTGTRFRISEYDGSESIITEESFNFEA